MTVLSTIKPVKRQANNEIIREYFLMRNFEPLPTDQECQSLIETVTTARMAGLKANLSDLIDGIIYAGQQKNTLASYWSEMAETPVSEEMDA